MQTSPLRHGVRWCHPQLRPRRHPWLRPRHHRRRHQLQRRLQRRSLPCRLHPGLGTRSTAMARAHHCTIHGGQPMAVIGHRAAVADPVPDTDTVSRAGCAQSASALSVSTNHSGADVGTDSAAGVLRPPNARCSTTAATNFAPASPPHVDQRPPRAFGSGTRSSGLRPSLGRGGGAARGLDGGRPPRDPVAAWQRADDPTRLAPSGCSPPGAAAEAPRDLARG